MAYYPPYHSNTYDKGKTLSEREMQEIESRIERLPGLSSGCDKLFQGLVSGGGGPQLEFPQ